MTTVFKIRNRKTGFFTDGGRGAAADSRSGKIWTTAGDVHRFLDFLRRDTVKLREQDNDNIARSNKLEARRAKRAGEAPKPQRMKSTKFGFDPDWEVVEFEMIEKRVVPVGEFMAPGPKGAKAGGRDKGE